MNDTLVTVVGNVATSVEYRETQGGGVARFRFAATPRRWDRERGVWTDGPTNFYTVNAWRRLGANVAASVSVGERLVVHGRLRVREEGAREGRRATFVDIDALAVGHDLTLGTAAFRRTGIPAPAAGPPGSGRDDPQDTGRDAPADADARTPLDGSVRDPLGATPEALPGAAPPEGALTGTGPRREPVTA
ncbi:MULTISPECIES: single-stranded DNA-binding protein [unclassified Streptomyces]|uniref:single-stranded DNA-binding protein n=1 Tax=unclassified Streptomyces TaxID=2593676 RepID=UPI0009A0D697|nr:MULTISPECIES: single-stranded DNA-binding protein [unclassified Streptomyces]